MPSTTGKCAAAPFSGTLSACIWRARGPPPSNASTQHPSGAEVAPGGQSQVQTDARGDPRYNYYFKKGLFIMDNQQYKKPSDAEEQLLCDQFGEPSHTNPQCVAGYYAKAGEPIVYSDTDNGFLQYQKETGLWNCVKRERLLFALGCFCHWLAILLGLPKLDEKRSPAFLRGVIDFLKGIVPKAEDVFVKALGQHVVHAANAMLLFDMERGWIPTPFSPDFYSRSALAVDYVPGAKAPRFLNELLRPVVSPCDIDLLQLFLGQCLLGENLSQRFLVLSGEAGSGKSTLVSVIESILGRQSCVEFRSQHAGGRFELGRLTGKKLLTAKDVGSEFLLSSGARKIKSLTGDDTLWIEFKHSDAVVELQGNFNLVITGNSMLRINIEGDVDAWKRRLLWVPFKRTAPTDCVVKFAQILVAEEGSGILNWALEGAAKLLRAGGKITLSTEQCDRVHEMLNLSEPFDCFAAAHIVKTPGASISTEEGVRYFALFCERRGWPLISEREAQLLFNAWMRRQGAIARTDINRNGRNKRGYGGYQFC